MIKIITAALLFASSLSFAENKAEDLTDFKKSTFIKDNIENSILTNEQKKLSDAKNGFIKLSGINSELIEKVIPTMFDNIILIKLFADKISPREPTYYKYLIKENSVVNGDIYFKGSYGLEPFDEKIIENNNLEYLNNYLKQKTDDGISKTVDKNSENEEAVIYVFVDTSCGYCRKYFNEIPELNKAGVSVRHIPYPRSFNPYKTDDEQHGSFDEISSTICAEDGSQRLGDYFNNRGAISDLNISDDLMGKCKTLTKSGFWLGQNVGVTGTPGTLFSDGSYSSGYMTASQMLRLLRGKKLIQ